MKYERIKCMHGHTFDLILAFYVDPATRKILLDWLVHDNNLHGDMNYGIMIHIKKRHKFTFIISNVIPSSK